MEILVVFILQDGVGEPAQVPLVYSSKPLDLEKPSCDGCERVPKDA